MADTVKDAYGYSNMTVTELRKVVTDLTKDNIQMQEEKKAFSASINDVLKENNTRIRAAVESLKTAELTNVDKAHEKSVSEFLKSVPKAPVTITQ